jgi:hypothetical protein
LRKHRDHRVCFAPLPCGKCLKWVGSGRWRIANNPLRHSDPAFQPGWLARDFLTQRKLLHIPQNIQLSGMATCYPIRFWQYLRKHRDHRVCFAPLPCGKCLKWVGSGRWRIANNPLRHSDPAFKPGWLARDFLTQRKLLHIPQNIQLSGMATCYPIRFWQYLRKHRDHRVCFAPLPCGKCLKWVGSGQWRIANNPLWPCQPVLFVVG